jgi:sugar O-acyltransferase (sialic acid O-acetyltransferase NeuD family)
MSAVAKPQVVVIGAGGHAKVVISTLRAAGHEVAAVFDDNPAKRGTRVLGVEVVGPIDSIADHPYESGIVAIGNNRLRKTIADRVGPGFHWVTAIHPGAHVDASLKIGAGSVVFVGAVIQPDVVIGAHVIINTGAIVEHDCTMGSFSQATSGTCLAGGVEVGEGAMLGIGTLAIPGVRIGSWSTVGAGSVVVRDLPENVVAVGAPARPTRAL